MGEEEALLLVRGGKYARRRVRAKERNILGLYAVGGGREKEGMMKIEEGLLEEGIGENMKTQKRGQGGERWGGWKM